MTISYKAPKTKQFIQELRETGPDKLEIVETLYYLFAKNSPEFEEKFIYGGIGMYLNDKLVGGIYVYREHVSLVFGEGYKLDDKYKVLEGGGKFRRHIKIKYLKDIQEKHCDYYIKQLI